MAAPARREEQSLSPLIAAAGALILLVSLFLDWYQPGLSAWTVFEVLDLVLAAIALAVLAMALSHVFMRARLSDNALLALGATAFIVVVSQIVNHPPAAQGASVRTGAWLALAGSALMAAAGILAATGISLSVSFARRPAAPADGDGERERPPVAEPTRGPSPATEAAAVEPEVHEELYPEHERRGPIGADDPEPWTATPEDETLSFGSDSEEERS